MIVARHFFHKVFVPFFFIENTFFLKRHQEIRASGTTLVDFHFEVSSGLLDIQSQFLTRREFFSGENKL